jgi:hypothetical protein
MARRLSFYTETYKCSWRPSLDGIAEHTDERALQVLANVTPTFKASSSSFSLSGVTSGSSQNEAYIDYSSQPEYIGLESGL